MPVADKPVSVEEIQGLYGPFQVSELLLQKIWHLGAFDAERLRDQEGRRVEVVFPGRWNRLAGPDFKGAELRIGGETVRGDIEVHFSAADWFAHGHDSNPAFGNVILHVLLRAGPSGAPAVRDSRGRTIPAVSLLEALWHSLEEYAQEDSLLASTSFDLSEGIEELAALGLGECRETLERNALERWRLKVHFARLRIEKLGWEEACHASALEVLGYRMNRIPMLLVASRFPFASWLSGGPDSDELWAAGRGKWVASGVRPANHPSRRLEQYRRWMAARPDWPSRLEAGFGGTSAAAWLREPVSRVRRVRQIGPRREEVCRRVCGGQLSGTRLDTLVCDALLPLVAAWTGSEDGELWFAWFAGDAPKSWADGLRRLQVVGPRIDPICNGWIQGVSRALAP